MKKRLSQRKRDFLKNKRSLADYTELKRRVQAMNENEFNRYMKMVKHEEAIVHMYNEVFFRYQHIYKHSSGDTYYTMSHSPEPPEDILCEDGITMEELEHLSVSSPEANSSFYEAQKALYTIYGAAAFERPFLVPYVL